MTRYLLPILIFTLLAINTVTNAQGPTGIKDEIIMSRWKPNNTQWQRFSAETNRLGECGEASLEASLSPYGESIEEFGLIWNGQPVEVPKDIRLRLVRPELASLQLECHLSDGMDGRKVELLLDLLFDDKYLKYPGHPDNYSYAILRFLDGRYIGWVIYARQEDGSTEASGEVEK